METPRELLRAEIRDKITQIHDISQDIEEMATELYDTKGFPKDKDLQGYLDKTEELVQSLMTTLLTVGRAYYKFQNTTPTLEEIERRLPRIHLVKYHNLRILLEEASEAQLQRWSEARPCDSHRWGEWNSKHEGYNINSCLDCNYVDAEIVTSAGVSSIGVMPTQMFCEPNPFDVYDVCQVPTPELVEEWKMYKHVEALAFWKLIQESYLDTPPET